MESRIGHLHYRVRLARGARAPAGLEEVARERVGEALGAALDAAFGDDPAVYVLRSIRADVAVDVSARQPDRVVAERWAERLASAIARAVAEEGDDGVARFEDEAEFVARFAGDLVDGVAWERWFYGAFAELRPLGRAAALRAVLLEHRDDLSEILAWLVRHGSLERVLAALDSHTLATLGLRQSEPELLRPLLAAAVRIAAAVGAPPLTGVSVDDLLGRQLQASSGVPSWRDRGALADAVLDALEMLLREHVVTLPAGEPADALLERAEPVLAELDWLDLDRLTEGMAELFAGPGARPDRSAARPAHRPPQLDLLGELAAAVRAGSVTLDGRDPASASNFLRLLAALAAGPGRRSRDRDAPETIAALLAAVDRVASHSAATEAWALLAAGDEPGAWRRCAAAGVPAADLELLRAAPDVVRALAPAGAGVQGSHASRWIDSPSAGALLPLRAAFDLRIPELAAAGDPPFPELLLAVALCLGGPSALEPRPDAGLSAALGFEQPPNVQALPEAWAGESIDDIAGTVLRAWAQWLRGFADSSSAFLLERFVRRPGRVAVVHGRAIVELEPRPLDLLLEMAGYLDPLEREAYLRYSIDFTLARG